MNEYGILWTAGLSLLGLCIASVLYALGGREGKWKRRYVASFVLTLTVMISSLLLGTFIWWSLLTYPLLIGTFCLGYGADTTLVKILRRSLVALCGIVATLPLIIPVSHYQLLPIQILLAICYVYVGVRNPVPAAAEETFVCAVLNLGLVMLPFVK